jgi:tRNA nucleotidyltransferase/poly(A) polymerase
VRELLAGEPAWFVGGAVRDELLGRPVVDVDVACAEPERAARRYARRTGGAPFPLSAEHGGWRVAFEDGHTVDFVPVYGGSIEADLGLRDFTVNAMAVPVDGAGLVDPFGGRADLEQGRLRAVSEGIFQADPGRLLRAVRFEQELQLRLDDETESLVRRDAHLADRPSGERTLEALRRLTVAGYERAGELGMLEPLGGSADGLRARPLLARPGYLLVAVLGEAVERLPLSNVERRFARTLLLAQAPADASPRTIHRFRRATEPWAVEAAWFAGAPELEPAIREAREREPAEPLLRGDELGLEPGPAIGRMLEEIAEERAAGTISTREEARELVRRRAEALRRDG